jgi:lysozyme
MDQNVHKQISEIDSAIANLSARIRHSLSNLDRKYSDIHTKLHAMRELSKVEGQRELNSSSDFFGKKFDEIADNIKEASLAQLQAKRNRAVNLVNMAAGSMRGTKQMRGVSEQYDLVLSKLDEEIRTRKNLALKLGDFLKRNSMDAISITAALTTRNPLIGLGIKYLLERRKAIKDMDRKSVGFELQDSIAYRAHLRHVQEDLKRKASLKAPKPQRSRQKHEKTDKFNQAQAYETPNQEGQTASETTRKTTSPQSNSTIIDAEFYDIPNSSSRTPRLLGAPSFDTPKTETPKPEATVREQNYDYGTILSWAKAQKRVSVSSIQRTFKLRSDLASKILQRLKADGVRVFEPKGARIIDMVPYAGGWQAPASGWFEHQSEASMPDEMRRQQFRQEAGMMNAPRMLSAAPPGAKARDGRGRFLKVENPNAKALVPFRPLGDGDSSPILTAINQSIIALDKNIVKFHKEDQKNQDLVEESTLESERQQEELISAIKGRALPGGSSNALVPKGKDHSFVNTALGTVFGSGISRMLGFGGLLGTGAQAANKFGMAQKMAAMGSSGAGSSAATAGISKVGGASIGMIGGSVLALGVDAVLGYFKAKDWKTSKTNAALGGMLGGTLNNKTINTFANMGKMALVGATAGSVFPVIGTLAGGLIGAALGGVLGMLGGEKVSKIMESSGIGRFVGSFGKMVGAMLSQVWRGLKSVFLGLKIVYRMTGFFYDTFIGPVTKLYNATLAPILKPTADGLKLLFNALSTIFEWTTSVINGGSDIETMVNAMLANDNLFEQVLGSFQRAFLDFAAGMLERVPNWMPGSEFLHSTARGFRAQSKAISSEMMQRAKQVQTPSKTAGTNSSAGQAFASATNQMNYGGGIAIPPKIADATAAYDGGSRSGMLAGGGARPMMELGTSYSGPIDSNPSSGRLSQSGLNAIKQYEGFAAEPYWDNKGYSIGYGHLMSPEESKTMSSVTKEQAEALLMQDTQKAQDAVNKLIKVPITQEMFDTLTSFTYNLGPGALAKIAETLNSGNYYGAAARMQQYIKAGGKVNSGLVSRRMQETGRFLSSMNPQQGNSILAMQKSNEDGRINYLASNNNKGSNVVVSSPKTQVSNTTVFAPQQNPRNTESTLRDSRYRNNA